jgi:tetratricopeptide (TPR) repeat protein
MFFGIGALTVVLFCAAANRYEVEFLPALVLLAVTGILSLERALAPTSEPGLAGQPVWRRAVRWGWSLLLGFSVAFNLLASAERCAEAHYNLGSVLLQQSKEAEAIAHFEQALRLNPDYAEAHVNLGVALSQLGRVQEASEQYEQALRIKPDLAEAHDNLGSALLQGGRIDDAIGQYEQALRVKPDLAEAHYNLGVALEKLGRTQEAIQHYEQALRTKPDFTQAQNALARLQAGQ